MKCGIWVINKSSRFLTSNKAQELRCTFIKPGDVLVARMPEPLGRACIFPGDSKRSVTVVDVCIIRSNPENNDRRWLMHCLNAPVCRNQIADFATGTTRTRISRGNLTKIKIPFPPLEEQKRIAEILDQAEELRTKRRDAIAQLNTLTQSIFIEMFGDPVKNPKGWIKKPLSSLVKYGDTINYGVVQPGDDFDGGVPLIRVGDIVSEKVKLQSLKYIDPVIEASYKRSRLCGDEILISCVGTIGAVALADDSLKGFNIARAVARIPLATTINRLFVATYLRTDFVQRYFINELRTVSQPTLNIKQISETMIILPPLPLQQEFSQRVEAVEKLKAAHRASLSELDALFASLQHRAFRGEL